ncbi:MAG: hypothetical protein ACI9JN_002032 [Bacteroidia bacterium]|jgi:hypothetical protein
MIRLKYLLVGVTLLLGLAILLSLDTPPKSEPIVEDLLKSTQTIDTTAIDTVQYQLHRLGTNNYSIDLRQIKHDRAFLLAQNNASISDSAKDLFIKLAGERIESSLVNSVFHYWYGTPWDFDGYTNTPNKGVVACGYFVSTTLKHIGFNLNRYRLAQQNPRNEALSIACGDSVSEFNEMTTNDVVAGISILDSGLYFVGLDNHVGFILVRQQTVFFIHASYVGDDGVCIEFANQSSAFASSSSYVLAPITTNRNLLNKWIKGEEITVLTSSD